MRMVAFGFRSRVPTPKTPRPRRFFGTSGGGGVVSGGFGWFPAFERPTVGCRLRKLGVEVVELLAEAKGDLVAADEGRATPYDWATAGLSFLGPQYERLGPIGAAQGTSPRKPEEEQLVGVFGVVLRGECGDPDSSALNPCPSLWCFLPRGPMRKY